MSVWRQWVFPIIRIIVFAVIAAALVKLAFFSQDLTGADPDVPTGEVTAPEVQVSRGSVFNTVTVSGTVNQFAARPLKATVMGEITEVLRKDGQSVKSGQVILRTITEEFDAEGNARRVVGEVKAPTTGKLTLSALEGQVITVGDELGSVRPDRFEVVAMVSPDQLYRLLDLPETAEVMIYGGPAPFRCDRLALGTGESGTEVSCRIPTNVTVFSGLMADINIPAGEALDVLVLPTSAVEGVAESGNVYVVLPDGTTEVRPVVLGLNDGFMVEIIEGVAEGETVLLYVPGASGDPGFGGEPGFPEPGFPEEGGEVVDDGTLVEEPTR